MLTSTWSVRRRLLRWLCREASRYDPHSHAHYIDRLILSRTSHVASDLRLPTRLTTVLCSSVVTRARAMSAFMCMVVCSIHVSVARAHRDHRIRVLLYIQALWSCTATPTRTNAPAHATDVFIHVCVWLINEHETGCRLVAATCHR